MHKKYLNSQNKVPIIFEIYFFNNTIKQNFVCCENLIINFLNAQNTMLKI